MHPPTSRRHPVPALAALIFLLRIVTAFFLSKNVLSFIRNIVSYLLSYRSSLVPRPLYHTSSYCCIGLHMYVYLVPMVCFENTTVTTELPLGQVGPGRATLDQEVGRCLTRCPEF